ncbi:MAG: lysophospholipase [Clostridia bacterium]|nr:lysophospholipase [Clostridia bacterium]
MSFEIKTLEVKSTDNIHTLRGKIFIPNGEIKGLFHLVHGMTEYIDRYDHLFSFFAENGFVAFGYDHLGHGKTAENDDELGFIAHKDGWKYLVNDVVTFTKAVKKIYPDTPTVLMGHSMGSFIARLVCESYAAEYDKFIFCGTSGPNPASSAGLLLVKIIKAFKGEKHKSNLIQSVAFGSYNNGFEGDTPYEWLTNDREIINKYAADKYCTFRFTVSAMGDLMNLLSKCNRGAWFKSLDGTKPILLIAGDKDPVGNYGKGVKAVYDKLIKNGKKCDIKLYENCRHEIHNDICKDEMFSDILKFLD